MIDDFSLALTQLIILLGLWRLTRRRDLDIEPPDVPSPPPPASAPTRQTPVARMPSLFGDTAQ